MKINFQRFGKPYEPGKEKRKKRNSLLGIIVFWVMFFNIKSSYMPVFERLSVYTLIIWSFISGVYLIKS